jgi:hypothetical protein
LYVRQPAHLCRLTKDALVLAQQLPNLPPVDVVHLSVRSVAHRHIVATPSVADSVSRKIYRGIHALTWLRQASEQGTAQAEQETRKRVRQQQTKSQAVGGTEAVHGSMKRSVGGPKSPPSNKPGFVSDDAVNESAKRRARMLEKIQGESDGLHELPAPKPPL